MNENMSAGLFLHQNYHQQMYLPIFCADRELVFDILCVAMDAWKKREQHTPRDDAFDFYMIAEQLGRTRTGCEGCFIGPEAVRYSDEAQYVFTADYENGRIVRIR